MRITAFFRSLLLLTVAAPAVAQEAARMQDEMGSDMRMIMATDDAKVFRSIRPVVAAMQVKLAEMGLFDGGINWDPSRLGNLLYAAVTAAWSVKPQILTETVMGSSHRRCAGQQSPGPGPP